MAAELGIRISHITNACVRIVAKLWSGETFPVRCRLCNELAYLPLVAKHWVSAVNILAVVVGVGAATGLKSMYPLGGSVLAITAAHYWLLYRVRLVGLSEDAAQQNKFWGNVSLLICACVALGVYLFYWGTDQL